MNEILKNKLVLISRSENKARSAVQMLENSGAEVIPFQTIKVVPVEEDSEIRKFLSEFYKFDYIIFSSANAAEMFQLKTTRLNFELDFSNVKIIAIGNKTAEKCKELNYHVDIIPDKFSAEGIITIMQKSKIAGKNILIPGSKIARDELPENLRKLGANVFTAATYSVTIPSEDDIKKSLEMLKNRIPDIFIFTSPSAFKNFNKILLIDTPESYYKNKIVAAIGPTTAEAIEDQNLIVQIVPDKYTIPDVVDSLIKYADNINKLKI